MRTTAKLIGIPLTPYAYLGGTRLTPDDAYRYARGETVTLEGRSLSRMRPLDFAAVTDHAEYIGEMYSTLTEGAPGHDQDLLQQLRSMSKLEDKGMKLLAIPHNSNASKGMMFPSEDAAGNALDLEYARTRQHFEPLIRSADGCYPRGNENDLSVRLTTTLFAIKVLSQDLHYLHKKINVLIYQIVKNIIRVLQKTGTGPAIPQASNGESPANLNHPDIN